MNTFNEKIMNYLSREFNGFDNCFLRYTVENLLIYAEDTFSNIDERLLFLDGILPEVSFDELKSVIE